MMRQDRFTEGAQAVLAASQEMVREGRHSQWDVEHVLMALVEYDTGITPQLFEKRGADRPRTPCHAVPPVGAPMLPRRPADPRELHSRSCILRPR